MNNTFSIIGNNLILNESYSSDSKIEYDTLLSTYPHHEKISKIKLFKDKKDTLYLGHLTTNLASIIQNGVLYPSAGCLVGSLYCFPVYKNGTEFVLHNLGNYILNTELPRSISAKNKNASIDMILFEVKNVSTHNSPILGINYLELGEFHKRSYDKLSFLLTNEERSSLENKAYYVITQVISVSEIVNLFKAGSITTDDFINTLSELIPKTLFLGYLLFEAMVVYITHNSCDINSMMCLNNNEIPNTAYKQFCFSLKSNLYANFSLSTFNPTIAEIVKTHSKLTEDKVIAFDCQSFLRGISNIFCCMFFMYLNPKDEVFSNNDLLRDSKDSVFEKYSSIFGHAIHRELRTFSRYEDFYFYFDQAKALDIWNIWNKAGVVIPYNAILKKGEVGLNPATPDIDISIYSTILNTENGTTKVKIKEKLPVVIRPKLNEFKHNLMRNI